MENNQLRRLGMLVVLIVAVAITIGGIGNYLDGMITIDKLIIGIPLTCFIVLIAGIVFHLLLKDEKKMDG